jgi:protein-tyrosine-phosphatase
LRDDPGKTALAIFNAVIKEVSNLENITDEWKVKDPGNLTKDEKKQVVENIRGHIRRMKSSDE